MGLFDTVRIHESIDMPEYEGQRPIEGWQTKGIKRPDMGEFEIAEDRQLYEEEFHYVEVPREERPKYNEEIDGFENEFEEFLGARNKIHDGWTHRKNFHGRFQVSHYDENSERLHLYEMKFTDGTLEDVTLVDKKDVFDNASEE